MENTPNFSIPAAERAEIFHEQYGNDIDAADTLADLVAAAGDYLGRIVGKETADRAMAEIVGQLAGRPLADPGAWRSVLDDNRSSCYSDWPLGARLHDLAAYALYGIILDGSDGEAALSAHLQELVKEIEAFLSASPMVPWKIEVGGESEISRLVRLARNRWSLDNGEPVEPTALAVFGGVSEGRIRNMMSGTDRRFSANEGLIPADQALAWLSGRDAFWNSVWRDQHLPQYGTKRTAPLRQAVFVPVGRDGSVFHPGLRRGSGYTIGERGAEQQVENFEEALTALQHMPKPYWRRPNDKGNWGSVAGVRWERLEASDLDYLAEHPDQKLPDFKTV